MRQNVTLLIYLLFILLVLGCEKDTPSDLSIGNIHITETYRNKVLDLPNGAYRPDNPNFDINKPDTWTGNMSKYVNHNYLYSVSYTIKNLGNSIAYDTEVDLHYRYDNGDEQVETVCIGNIQPHGDVNNSTSTGCTNKQLIECSCEVFWNY
jgi:hypothetical protein